MVVYDEILGSNLPGTPGNAKDIMKKYVDPIAGTISYSGADFKAVVFLPVPLDKVREELSTVNTQLSSLRSDFEVLNNSWVDFSRQYANAVARGDVEAQATYTQELRDINSREISKLAEEIWVLNSYKTKLENMTRNSKGDSVVKPLVLGDVQTVTYSIFREKFPVRTCGRTYAKSYTRGPRTVGGSLIFTILNKHALYDLLEADLSFYSSGVGKKGTDSGFPEYTTAIPDQLPPFDITLVASNEIGDTSYMVLYGVEITQEGQVMSIQDMITENVMQFVARDIDPLRSLGDKRRILDATNPQQITASEVAKNSKARRDRRLNPFV